MATPAPQLTPWFYVADPAELPAPHDMEHPPCMADPAARYTPQGLFVPGTCCWYHQGSWDEASRAAVALTLAAQAEGVPAGAIEERVLDTADAQGITGYRCVQEFPAFVKHEGVPRRPTEIRRVDAPLAWRVVELVHAEADAVFAERQARRIYRLQVFGPLPYAPEQRGAFEMLAVDYSDCPYWWLSLPGGP